MSLLCYWLRGTPFGDASTIETSLDITVKELTKLIIDDANLPTRRLCLYNVACHDVHQDDMDKFGRLSISELLQPLKERATLRGIMPNPLLGHFHVVVERLSPVPITCWLRNSDRSFEVEVFLDIRVDGLKNKIKSVHLNDAAAYCMDVYQISTYQQSELSHSIHTPKAGRLLEGDHRLEDIFRDLPFRHNPYVVIEMVGQEPPALRQDLRDQYFLALAAQPLKAPSDQALVTNFKKFQSSDCRIDWTRPFGGYVGIPVTLLERIFGEFVDDCHDFEDKRRNYDTESDTNELVARLHSEMCNLFEKEKGRRTTFYRIFRDVGFAIMPSSSDGFATDGDMHVNGGRYLILEVNAEIGSNGAEPYCQAVLYYIKATETDARKAHAGGTPFNFPCLTVTLFGAHMGFSGVVWAARPTYQLLCSALPLFWHPKDLTMRRVAARQINAFKNALVALRSRYEQYCASPTEFQTLQPEYPHPRSYQGPDGKTNFDYVRVLEEKKLLFVVKTDAGEEVCVKFTQTYDRSVHEECAKLGITPSLRAFEDIPGGWKMVVMDLLDDYRCFFDIKKDFSLVEKERLKTELHAKLTVLHQAGFVHGDVRDTNVMVSKDRLTWRLVDFDWSGRIGQVRYPMNVNRGQGLTRPDGARDGLIIRPEHDIDMLDYLFF